jgi:hypothetical protein
MFTPSELVPAQLQHLLLKLDCTFRKLTTREAQLIVLSASRSDRQLLATPESPVEFTYCH